LDSLKKSAQIITDEFKMKFINFPEFDENNNEKAQFNQIKNSFFGYCYINDNKLIDLSKDKVNFSKLFNEYKSEFFKSQFEYFYNYSTCF